MTAGYVVICQGWTMKLCRGRDMPPGGILLYSRTATLFRSLKEARAAIKRSKRWKPDHTLHNERETFVVRLEKGC